VERLPAGVPPREAGDPVSGENRRRRVGRHLDATGQLPAGLDLEPVAPRVARLVPPAAVDRRFAEPVPGDGNHTATVKLPLPTVARRRRGGTGPGRVPQNRIDARIALLTEATALARKIANGPTRAYAAHKALLRAWSVGGVCAADEAVFDIAMPLFETDDVKAGLASAVTTFKAGLPRPAFNFRGH
jgi:hypothetical protein